MTYPAILIRRAALLGTTLLLGACGGAGQKLAVTPPPATAEAVSGWAGRADVGGAIDLLGRGEATTARAKLIAVLRRQPSDSVAQSLVKQIDTPAEELLGAESFAYVSRDGDTMSSLAARFLGNPILFYALSRYNGIDAPSTLAPGRTLRIPGHDRRPTARPDRTPPKPAAATPKVAVKPKPLAPAAPVVDPRRAAQLRAAGLEQMNRGAIDRAVGLLAQASRADPANMVIRRDLDRATRIQRTVRARPR